MFSHVFSYEYLEIFKNSFFIEHLRWLLLSFMKHIRTAASEHT